MAARRARTSSGSTFDFAARTLTSQVTSGRQTGSINALTVERATGDYVAFFHINTNFGVQRVVAGARRLRFTYPWTTAGGPGTGFPSRRAIHDRVCEYCAPEPPETSQPRGRPAPRG